MNLPASKEILLQHSVSNYRIYLYIPEHRLAIEANENVQKNRNEYKELKRKNAIKILDCKFIRLILVKKIPMGILQLVKYTITLKNHLKTFNRQDFKKMIKFKSNHLMKLKSC